MLEVAGAVALVATAYGVALRPAFMGTYWAFAVLSVPYAAMTVLYVVRSAHDGVLSDRLRPRSGDLTLGALVAGMLFCAVLVGRSLLAPHGSAHEGWLMQLYLRFGEPDWVQRHLLLLSALTVLLALLEEVAWRGYVLSVLEGRFGVRVAWPATAVLNALACLPTAFLVRDPFAGANPLVVLAVLGSGLAWGFLVAQTRRLPVAMLSHALFAWATLVQFPLWRLG